jgi:hypothetical protein
MNFARTIIFSILTAFLFIIPLCSYSQEDSSKKAKEIYTNAKDNLNKLNYKTVLEKKEKENERIIDMFFHKVNRDGTVFTRREIIREPNNPKNALSPYIVIINDHGHFLLTTKSKAFKIDFQLTRKEIDETGLNISFSLSDGDYKGTPCYIITRKIEPNQLAYERYIEALPDDLKPEANRKKFETSFSVLDVSYIAKNDNFFRKVIYYEINGKRLGFKEYGEVAINPSFDEGLFKVPDTCVIQILHSFAEYIKYTTDIIDNEYVKPISPK